jgi:enamine deaminase RidA (YjgF/YER057c/UK114 family)
MRILGSVDIAERRCHRSTMDQHEIVVPEGTEFFYERLHFAPAVKDGDRLFCSGVIGLDPDGTAPADPEAQFTRAFEALAAVLTAAGASFGDVVDLTTFHVGLQAHLRAFARVKDRFVAAPYPAWTAIGVSELAVPGGLVEIRAVARLR